MPTVAIVGGGISGLSTAYYLSKAGISSTLIEARPRLGGVIRTERIHECVVEGGPDSFLSAKPWAMDLIRDLGMAQEVIASNDHQRKTFIWKRGRLVEFPEGVQLLVPTKIVPMALSPLVSWGTKVRMGLEWFRRPDPRPQRDRAVAEFVEEHYGREAVDYLAEPLLAGIYGGDPDQLSITSVLPRFVEIERKYGSLTRGVLAERRASPAGAESTPLFRTLRGGMESLIEGLVSAIAGKITVVHAVVDAVERDDTGFRLRVNYDWVRADRVVLASEAHQAARMSARLDGRISDLFGSIGYSPSMTVALGFERRAVESAMRGFGFLVPKPERKRLLAGTWVGNKFPNRVPESVALLRCFLGGVGGGSVLSTTEENILESVREELREILGITAEPLFSRIFRWPQSMAQYTTGHLDRIAELESRLAAFPGLLVAGNGYHGIGVPDCVRMGKQAAERIASTEPRA